MMDCLFSIIVPHRNIPKLLERCLHSIPRRPDLQVIVVDDNSDETFSPELKNLEQVFNPWTFIYVREKGMGAGHARNVGLDAAKGRWLLFADADDFFVEDINDILETYKDAEEDILYFRNLSVLSDNTSKSSHRDDWIDRMIATYNTLKDEYYIRCNHCVPWGKMLHRAFITQQRIRFDEVMYSNDVMFGLRTGCQAKEVQIIDRPLYVLTERAGSLTSGFAEKPGELKTRAEVCFRAQSYINGLGEPYASRFECMSVAQYMSRMFHQDKSLFASYYPLLSSYYPSYFAALKQIRLHEKNRWDKLQLYLYSFWICLKQGFPIFADGTK